MTKKNYQRFFVVLGLVIGSRLAFAEPPKVGVLDMQKAMFEVKRGKSAKNSLQKEAEEKEKIVEKEQTAIRKLSEDFQKKAAHMNDKARMEKGAELQKKIEDLQRTAQGYQAEFQKKNEDAFRPLVEGLRALIPEVARRRKLDMVFENNTQSPGLAPGSTLVYAVDKTDITEEAIKLFDEKNP